MTDPEIAGRYKLDRRLGAGGMSTVHLALDTRLERYVAVKLLAEHLAEDPTFVSRFQREAMAAARLVHPNIVQVFDSGLDESSGRHYIVMEYIHGHSGAELLREYGKLDLDETLAIVLQACHGLAYAHRHGVVHRDVKPGNLLRSEDAVVKLADFGIAKAAEQSSITQVGSVLGTAAYLAPEQARGEDSGPAADLYSLGVVAYQLLSGRLPYEAASLSELALKQQSESPPSLHMLDPEIPPALGVAIERALALEPGMRYESAHEMAEALEAGARGIHTPAPEATASTRLVAPATASTRAVARPAPATPLRPRPGPPRARRLAPVAGAPAAAAPLPRRRRRSLGPLAALALIALVLAGGAYAISSSSSSGGSVHLRNVVYRDVQQAVDQLKGLLSDNTR